MRNSWILAAVCVLGQSALADTIKVERLAVAESVVIEATSEQLQLVKAKVKLGSNSCTSEGLQASLLLDSDEQTGRLTLTPLVVGEQDSSQFCVQIYDPIYQEVSIALPKSLMLDAGVVLKNANTLGEELDLISGETKVSCTNKM